MTNKTNRELAIDQPSHSGSIAQLEVQCENRQKTLPEYLCIRVLELFRIITDHLKDKSTVQVSETVLKETQSQT